MTPWQWGDWAILRPLWLVPIVPLLITLYWWRQERVYNDWRDVLSTDLFAYLGADHKHHLRSWNLALIIATVVCLSLSQPSRRQSDDDTWRHSIGWVAVADVSRSMTLNDTVPSRLSAMREALAELSHQAAARPISLILFSGDAFLVSPPAFDRSVFNEQIALLEHGIIPIEGSNLTRALSLASAVIKDSQFRKARVFVLGDSGGVVKSSLSAAQFLADEGHRLDMLVFGSTGPSQTNVETVETPKTTQLADSSSSSWAQQAQNGDETTVNWAQAQAIANIGNGISVHANQFGVIDFEPLELDQQDTASTHTELKSLVWQDQSNWLLLFAIPLLLRLFQREAGQG